MKKVKVMVFCRNETYGKLDFYLLVDEKELYLFTTNFFSRNIYERYRNGQRIEQLFENTSKVRQQKLSERLLRMVRYMAVEESIPLAKKTKKTIHKEADDYDYEVA